ncbi:hypothetical protein HY988_00150 [Candidatus Micrarchaeota archaeon]|nr:hypothetical protein [Candidatus Micrarchaeota archaeon]
MSREILLIVALLIVIVLIVKVAELFQKVPAEADASRFVLEDLNSKYRNAGISIMSIAPRTNDNGGKYFEVKTKVVMHPQGACPERSHIYYNYPTQNFVPQPSDVVTSNCVVCQEKSCTIAFPEEAVIGSHTLTGTEMVQAYVDLFGSSLLPPQVTEGSDSWTVKWDSTAAQYYLVVSLKRNGVVTSVKKFDKARPA